MLKIGLTGGIGSGKSVVARRLAQLGAVIIDADRIAREVVAPGTEGLREIATTFGSGVLQDDGSLDRAALGVVVFGDHAARARLEAITHPRVRARTAQLVAEAPPDAIVVNDVPLLVEVGLAATYHLVIVVETEQSIRIDRLVRDRGMSAEEAYQRIRAQTSDALRRAAADALLTNNGRLDELHAAVDALWQGRLVPYERNVRERRVAPMPPTDGGSTADPTWPAQFARLAARIGHALGPAVQRIDQVGPASVAGLPSVDVIEIRVGVAADADLGLLAGQLADAGFPPVSSATGAERRHGGADPARPVDLRLGPIGLPNWRAALLLRDYLRDDPQRWSATSAYDEQIRSAEQWAVETGWEPSGGVVG
ncbi:dephospho-CoA kinase [Micromonospora polyrhachis]|uniref:Dephospho-CoA kinase n=1 Tax=Micromonospora polyrhachis TaxID=1282883 RepID=A0A7W7SV05_9ACTN|nr:dephospho-CoA kinase [Micromonospora polyrhachis]MBB4961401.1 dephospho-CoA kinase [Micromonospora polyrhachis]